MGKANVKELDALHKLLTQYYADQLENGEELSSGTLAAINTFLKNNDVKVDIVENNTAQNLSYKIRNLVREQEA